MYWLEHNDLVFDGSRWHKAKTERVIEEDLWDYGRLKWQHTMQLVGKHPKKEDRLWERFDEVWCSHLAIHVHDGCKVKV